MSDNSAIGALPSDIVEWLSSQSVLSGIRFMTEYPPTKKAIPLKSAIVAVGLEHITLEDSFTETDGGVLVENEYCRIANLKIKLAIHIPFSDGGARCHDVFTSIIDCLTFASDLNIVESGCSEIQSDRDTDALVLNAWILVLCDFCPAVSSGLSFQTFLSKDLLCGSHVSNNDIHVTATDKAYWNSPFYVGHFIGNGTTIRKIDLDFTPRFVFLFSEETSFIVPDCSDCFHTVFSAAAVTDCASNGIEIVSGGFRTLQGSGYTMDNCEPRTNMVGHHYGFIAFK